MRRAANTRVRQLVEEVADDPAPRAWEFFCECGRPECNALVQLQPGEFDALTERSDGHVLADGHAPAGVSMVHAADLQGSALAVQRRAEQLIRNMSGRRRLSVELRLEMSHADFLDAAEDIGGLLDRFDELDLSPACRDLLLALDDAIALTIPS
jgi:hypothetical protein